MGKLKPKVLVAQYDAVAIERIKAEWMQSPLWMKDYHVLLNGIQSLQNDNNMLRRKLLTEGEIGADASFKPRRLAAAEESIFDSLSDEEFEQWVDIMSRINWASLNAGDRRRLSGDGDPALLYYGGCLISQEVDEESGILLKGASVVIKYELDDESHSLNGYVERIDKDHRSQTDVTLIVRERKDGGSFIEYRCGWSDGTWHIMSHDPSTGLHQGLRQCTIYWPRGGEWQKIRMNSV